MQPHKLRERAKHLRGQAYAAPSASEERAGLAEAADLERRAADLEKTSERRELEAIADDLKRARMRADSAEKSLEHRNWLISQIIGRPLDGMSQVAIGAAVHAALGDLRKQA